MEGSQEDKQRNDSPVNSSKVRKEKGKKRTQILMSGYKGQKEEFINAFNQSLHKDSVNELLNYNASLIQQNEQSLINDPQDQEGDLLNQQRSKKLSPYQDKHIDSQGSPQVSASFEQIPVCLAKSINLSQGSKKRGMSNQMTISKMLTQKKVNPYQGQDILNSTYFDHKKIYEGKNLQTNEESTNLPLIMKLKDIANRLANSLQSRRQKQLNESSYQLINDKSYFVDKKDAQVKGNFFNFTRKTLLNYFNYFLTHNVCTKPLNFICSYIPIFLPSNTYKFLWDILQLCVIIACIWFVPIIFVFKMRFKDLLPSVVSWIGIILLILDIPINMNTGFYDKGVLIQSRRLIFTSYLKKNYIYDILSIVPLLVHFLSYELDHIAKEKKDDDYNISGILTLLILFKIYHMRDIIRRVEERYHPTPRTMNIVALIKLLCTVLFVAHIFSQIWLFAAFIETTKTSYSSWLQFYNLSEANWVSQYIRAYYFATVTMITVGYGDTLPTNDPEMILCIFTMLIACGVFAYSVNLIGMILMDFSSREKEIKDNLCTINNYMDQKNVNQDLQYKIRQYLEYYWREMKDSNIEKEEKIISQLSELLRDELLLEANKFILKESPIFSSNFTDYMIIRTVKLIHEYRCAPKEIICFEDQEDDCSIYFIQKGEIDIYLDSIQPIETSSNPQNITKTCQNKTKILQTLKKGDHFGGISFFTGHPRKYSICSKEFTTLLMIKRQDFIDLLTKESPEDYEMFCAIKDNILNYNNYSQLNTQCFSCRNDNHLMGECPIIHYNANKELIIRKAQYSPPQICDRSFLRRKTTIKPLLKLKYIQERIARFCDDDEKEGEKVLDMYEAAFGIESLSSESTQQSSTEYEDPNKKMKQSIASEKSDRISMTSIAKRNSMRNQYQQRNEVNSDEVYSQEASNNYIQQSDGGYIYSQKNILKVNDFQAGFIRNVQGGSTGKISQKNISSSENVLEESDHTKVAKIGEHLLYGSDAGLQNTHTQFAKSFKTWEDKGNISYQISSSQVSKQKSKINSNTLYQLSIGSAGSANNFMNINGISDLSEQLMADARSRKSKSLLRNSTKSKSQQNNSRNDYEILNNEMRYIDDNSFDQNIIMQYQMITDKLGKCILDVQLNQYIPDDQKIDQINAINSIMEKLKINPEPDRVGSQMYKMNESRKSSQVLYKYNVYKIQTLFNQLFGGDKSNDYYQDAKSQNTKLEPKNIQKSNEKNKKEEVRKISAEEQRAIVNSKQKINDQELLFDLKKSYIQYFPHNNCERVIQIANMSQSDRRKKLNKIITSRKMNKVERKQGKNNTRMFANQSKFNKLLNTFQNQTEAADDETNDNLSQKSRKQSIYRRKISLFGQQNQNQNDVKFEHRVSQESNNSQKTDKNQNQLNDKKICISDLNYEQSILKQNSSNKQTNPQRSSLKCEEGNTDTDKEFQKRMEQQEQIQNQNEEIKEIPKQLQNEEESKNTTTTPANKQNQQQVQNNFLQFQRPAGKKKLSEIPENECQSSMMDTNSVMVGSQTRNLIHASIQKDLTESSIDHNFNSNAFSRQESMNLMYGSKRPSYFFNQEVQSTNSEKQQNDNSQYYNEQGERIASSKNIQNKLHKAVNSQDLILYDNKSKHESENIQNQGNQGHKKSYQFENNEQWFIGHGKDDGINPIFSMNIDLSDVKKYHKWGNSDPNGSFS